MARGACMVDGGTACMARGMYAPCICADTTRYGDTVNEWPVRILWECILVTWYIVYCLLVYLSTQLLIYSVIFSVLLLSFLLFDGKKCIEFNQNMFSLLKGDCNVKTWLKIPDSPPPSPLQMLNRYQVESGWG